MARLPFAGTANDYTFSTYTLGSQKLVALTGATLTFYDAETGGNQVTDLTDVNGAAISSVTVPADGGIPRFYGPDGVTELWASANGSTTRTLVTASMADQLKADYVPVQRTVNGKALSADVTLTPADTGAQSAASLEGDVAGKIGKGGALDSALSTAIAGSAASAAAPLWGKLRAAQADAQILLLGDSTGDGRSTAGGPYADEWPEKLLAKIAAQFPAWTVQERRWSGSPTNAYDAATTVQTGTNGHTLTLYNGSAGGTTWDYHLTTPDAHWRALSPDLILINYGHNDNALASPDRIPLGIEPVTAVHDAAGLVLFTQNLRGDNSTYEAQEYIRAQQFRVAASKRGYGLVDVARVFQDQVNSGVALSSLLNSDLLHPNDTGYTLWANEAWRAMWSDNPQPIPRASSSLNTLLPGLLTNATFSQTWGGTGNPPGWTLTNATATQDTTHFETGTYAIQLAQVSTTAGVRGHMEQSIPVAPYAGRWVTVAFRLYIDPAMTNTQVATTYITDSVNGEYFPRQCNAARGRFFWAVASKFIPANATGNLTIGIYNDYSLSTGANSKPTIDRVSLTRGTLPVDVY